MIAKKVMNARSAELAIAKCIKLGGVKSEVSGLTCYTFADSSIIQFAVRRVTSDFVTWNAFANAEQQAVHLTTYRKYYV